MHFNALTQFTSNTLPLQKQTEEAEGAAGDEKKAPPTWMFNKDGVAYAPWMVDTFDPEV
jgi:hypothetical protein